MRTTEVIRLTEPVPIDDDLCTGLALVEDVGGFGARLVFFSEQTCYEAGETVNVVRRKVVLPLAAIAPAIEKVLNFSFRDVTPASEALTPTVTRGGPILHFPRETT